MTPVYRRFRVFIQLWSIYLFSYLCSLEDDSVPILEHMLRWWPFSVTSMVKQNFLSLAPL